MKQKREKRERPNWDEFFMFSALWTATRSSCSYIQVGAVIVKDKRIVAAGYNGAPPGIKNCLEVGCRKEREGVDFHDKGRSVCRGNHAEMNAINQIAREDLKGSSLYTLYYPCSPCAKVIDGNGIREVIYCLNYYEPESLAREIFDEAKIKVRRMPLPSMSMERYFGMINHVLRQKRA